MSYKAELFINIDAVVAGAEYIGSLSRFVALAEKEVFSLTKSIIYEEFLEAVHVADSDFGFPIEFQNHLMGVVSTLTPTVVVSGDLFISIDLGELGDYDDLQKAFHQGAQIEGGGQVEGPYTGQPLKQDDPEIRHQYWEALRAGQSRVDIQGKSVKVFGSWDETVQRYINIWGSKAPEWLFIQFGQEEWQPYIPQVDIVNNIETRLYYTVGSFLQTIMNEAVAVANTYKSTGLEVGYTGSKSPPRVTSGTFVSESGKVYRPGRFAPRGGI